MVTLFPYYKICFFSLGLYLIQNRGNLIKMEPSYDSLTQGYYIQEDNDD
jgi:hypothetical protein